VRISFDTLEVRLTGHLSRSDSHCRMGRTLFWDSPFPPEWPKRINLVRRYSWERKHTNQAMKFR